MACFYSFGYGDVKQKKYSGSEYTKGWDRRGKAGPEAGRVEYVCGKLPCVGQDGSIGQCVPEDGEDHSDHFSGDVADATHITQLFMQTAH